MRRGARGSPPALICLTYERARCPYPPPRGGYAASLQLRSRLVDAAGCRLLVPPTLAGVCVCAPPRVSMGSLAGQPWLQGEVTSVPQSHGNRPAAANRPAQRKRLEHGPGPQLGRDGEVVPPRPSRRDPVREGREGLRQSYDAADSSSMRRTGRLAKGRRYEVGRHDAPALRT